jgi:hypothetical protein
LNFDPAFIYQGLEAVIQTANAHAKFSSQLTLSYFWAVLKNTQNPEVGVFLLVGLATSQCSSKVFIQATAVPDKFSGTLRT